MSRRSVAVTIAGHDYKIRSDADADELRRVAGYVDAAMQKIRKQTDTHDSFDVAVLTCLNLARDILAMRDRLDRAPSAESLSSLARLVEQALTPSLAVDGEALGRTPSAPAEGVQQDPRALEARSSEATVHSVGIHLERIAERAAKAEGHSVDEVLGPLAAGEAKR